MPAFVRCGFCCCWKLYIKLFGSKRLWPVWCFVNIYNILILFKACSDEGFCGRYIYKNSLELFFVCVSIFGSHIGIHCFDGFCFVFYKRLKTLILFFPSKSSPIRGYQVISGDIRGLQGSSGVIRGRQGPSGVIRGHQVISCDVLFFFWLQNCFF